MTENLPGTICLPQELYDLVIDELGVADLPESRSALSTCALVCHSFHSRASGHLFANITMTRNGDPRTHSATAKRLEALYSIVARNPDIATRVKSFAFDTWFNPNTPPAQRHLIFGNAALPAIISQFSSIRHFSWTNRRGILPWAFFDGRLSSTIHELCTTPSLRSLNLECITGVPFSYFSQSHNLKHLHLIHVEPAASNPPSAVLTTSHTTDNNIQLQSLVACYASQMLSAIAYGDINASSIFSSLRDLRVWMRHSAEVDAAWSIMQAAAQTLEVLDITELSHVEDITVPVDLGLLPNLRTVKTKCRLSAKDGATFPLSILRFLEPSKSTSSIAHIAIAIDWVDFKPGDEAARFDDPGWAALDDVLARPAFRNLHEISLELKMGSIPPAQSGRVKKLVHRLAMRSLPRASLLPVKLSVCVDIYNTVYA